MRLDYVNAIFELGAAIVTWLNVRRLHHDRIVRGINWQSIAFFTLWGLWNLVYYPTLGQWFSFCAGILLTLGNIIWVISAIYFVASEHKTRG